MLSPAKLDIIAVSCAFGNPGNQPGVSLTILHLSDLHFHALPRTFPEWASKRVLGAANLVLRRAQHYPLARAKALVEQVRALSWDHLVISGDLTQLALEQEFEQAREVLSPLLENPECVTVLPGNHDRYVAAAQFPEDRFQKHFGEFWTEGPLWAKALGEGWHLLGWDSTHPNDWWSACGTVPQATIAATERHLSTLPDNAKVLLCPDQRGLDHACVPPTMRWRVREGGPERRQLCDGGRFIAVESKEAELVALKISSSRGPLHQT